ncbi:energy transducer TonB [Pelomonas sp. Root1444]|uniref:energy transducer TonB n=1 Tax=Pelomonas sp. Root1444 TaxID=1736464 RepID=UPI000A7D6405|nr:energy transducer TonB [Pelomonas sp. Root1444]
MTHGPRPKLALTLPAIAGALMVLAQPAHAQNDAPKADGLERAQKAADAVFHWIKVNADKGASRTQPSPPPPPPPPPAPAPARKPAAVAAAPKPAPAAAPAQARADAPAAAPVAAPVAVRSEPEPERTPVLLATAAPTPEPAAPLAAAARAVEPPPAPAPAEEAEVPLKLLVKVNPAIPRQLQQQSFRNGVVQVQFTVAPDGSVSQAHAVKVSHSRLGAAAVEAIKQWRFAPIPKAREAAVEVAFASGEE